MSYYTGTTNWTQSGTDFSLTADVGEIYGTSTYVYEPLIKWLPNSCKHKKYLPTWHLVRSYK